MFPLSKVQYTATESLFNSNGKHYSMWPLCCTRKNRNVQGV